MRKTDKKSIVMSLDDSDVYNVLKCYVNNHDILLVVHDAITASNTSCEWLFKIHLGKKYPTVPKIGTLGYISIDKYKSWSGDIVPYKNSTYNKHGFIPVEVITFDGTQVHYPLKVQAPLLKDPATGTEYDNIFRVNIEDFIPDDEFDAYDATLLKQV